MRGIYLTAPDGRVLAELHVDPKVRARQRWHRAWQPHQDVKPDQVVSCNPSNPTRLCPV